MPTIHNATVRILCLLMLFGLTACAASTSMMERDQPAPMVRPDQAVIVFMRPSILGSAITASVFDVTGSDSKFIGFVNSGLKVAHAVPPGERTFMVVSEAADFMQAKIEAGKTYHVLVTPRVGVWRARFSFRPVRSGEFAGSEFAGWESSTKYAASTPQAESWARDNMQSITSKRQTYWPEWTGKALEQRQSQTLNPEDGR